MSTIRINPEDGGSELFWNVGNYLPIYCGISQKILIFLTLLWEPHILQFWNSYSSCACSCW